VYDVIFGNETRLGKIFDVGLIIAIIASVAVVMLDSVPGLRAAWGPWLRALEWMFTLGFTAEYVLRLWCVKRADSYAFSFFGAIDLLAVIPTYVSLVLPGGQFLAVVRILRVVRVFRVLKLVQYASWSWWGPSCTSSRGPSPGSPAYRRACTGRW
jgi:voltage-gated potassium channel